MTHRSQTAARWMLLLLAIGQACDSATVDLAPHATGVAGSTSTAVSGTGPAAGMIPLNVAGSQASGASAPVAGASAGSNAAGTSAASGNSFSRVWNEIIIAKGCGSVLCHGAGQGELVMDSPEHAHANLVNVPAAGPECGASGKLRVKPSDPDASLLLDKISHAKPACGAPMPIAAKFAPDDCVSPSPTVCTQASEVSLVRAWIAAGAAND